MRPDTATRLPVRGVDKAEEFLGRASRAVRFAAPGELAVLRGYPREESRSGTGGWRPVRLVHFRFSRGSLVADPKVNTLLQLPSCWERAGGVVPKATLPLEKMIGAE